MVSFRLVWGKYVGLESKRVAFLVENKESQEEDPTSNLVLEKCESAIVFCWRGPLFSKNCPINDDRMYSIVREKLRCSPPKRNFHCHCSYLASLVTEVGIGLSGAVSICLFCRPPHKRRDH